MATATAERVPTRLNEASVIDRLLFEVQKKYPEAYAKHGRIYVPYKGKNAASVDLHTSSVDFDFHGKTSYRENSLWLMDVKGIGRHCEELTAPVIFLFARAMLRKLNQQVKQGSERIDEEIARKAAREEARNELLTKVREAVGPQYAGKVQSTRFGVTLEFNGRKIPIDASDLEDGEVELNIPLDKLALVANVLTVEN
jgi:hypothetical protein